MEEGDAARRRLDQLQAIIRANKPERYDPKSDICYLLFVISSEPKGEDDGLRRQ
jgi:hypothetical protein